MKAYLLERIERRKLHHSNTQLLPPETHRIVGWTDLSIYVGYNREKINKWIKLEGFPKGKHHYRQKTDANNHRQNVWRRVAVWDKRDIGDWFARR